MVPEIGEQQYNDFVNDRLVTCKKSVADNIKKNNFSTPLNPRPIIKLNNSSSPKDTEFNKLRSAVYCRPEICMDLFEMEFTRVPVSLTKKE